MSGHARAVTLALVIWSAAAQAGDGGGPTVAAGPTHPFGSHPLKYPAGAALPTGQTAALDATVAAYYDQWKRAYLATGCGGQYIKTSGGTGAKEAITVSEGHGYGMLAVVLMAGHDPDARTIFDAMLRLYRAFPSTFNADLMAWAIGPGCKAIAGPDSATDGDLDVAFALLMADRQWGSGGAINYLTEARKTIAAAKTGEMHPQHKTPLLGDWVKPKAKEYDATRPSDFMLDHFRAFAAATNDPFWTGSVDALHVLIADLQARHAPRTGLLPDFVVKLKTRPTPAPPRFLEESTDGMYGYNACRVPWRLVTDWVVSGDARDKAALGAMLTWAKAKTGGDPGKLVDGYTLAGAAKGKTADDCFEAPLGAAGIIDGGHQAWVDAAWKRLSRNKIKAYFPDSVKLFTMIVMTGNWWTP